MAKVYVGNLAWRVSRQELMEFMSSAGEVLDVVIFEDDDGRSKGAGIVEYANADAAATAIDTLTDSDLGGRSIFVREDRGKGGGKSKGKGFDKGFEPRSFDKGYG